MKLDAPPTPKCFDDEQSFVEWLVLARQSGILDVYPHAKAFSLQVELESADGDYRAMLERNLRSQLERASHYEPRDPPYCVDCTLHHRDKMKREGRCAYPGTKFRLSLDDASGAIEIVGDRAA